MSTREEAVRLHAEGYSLTEIAKELGVTRQRIHQIVGGPDYKRFTTAKVIYPNLRKWLNDNRITWRKLLTLMGVAYHASNIARYRSYFKGTSYPPKPTIDKLIRVTGLTYEQLFYEEVD